MSTPVGQLVSPYSNVFSVAEQGHKLFQAYETAAGVMAVVVVAEWRRLSPMRFGSTAAMTIPCSV